MTPPTLKAVAEFVERMRADQLPEGFIAEQRARMFTEVKRRYARRADCNRSVPVSAALRRRLDRLASIVQRFFPNVDDLSQGRKKPPFVMARQVFVRAARDLKLATWTELAVYLRRPGKYPSLIYLYQTAPDEMRVVADRVMAAYGSTS